MDEELLLHHPCIFPSPAESSNVGPAFGRDEAHIGVYLEDPFPKSEPFSSKSPVMCIQKLHTHNILMHMSTSISELSPPPTIFSRSASEMDSSFSISFPFPD